MKKLVLICILAVGVSFGNNFSQAIKENCGNVPLSQCIDFYKKQCSAGKMIHCGFAGMLYVRHDIYKARRYYKMACDRINLKDDAYEMQTADNKRFKYNFDSIKYAKSKFCYNFAVTYRDNLKDIEKDFNIVLNATRSACNLGHSRSCDVIQRAEQLARQRRR